MNSQELRSLQEAYNQVYAPQELDEAEGSYGQTPKASAAYTALAFGKGKSKTKSLALKHLIRSAADRYNSDKPYSHRSKMTQSDRDYHRGQSENGGKDREGIDFDEFDTGASGPGGKPKGKKLERQIKRGVSAESFDLYDIILSHLLDEGYAETQEQAEVIMVNMSEDWRESIMIDEGLDMKTFKANRKKAQASATRADAVKRGHVGKEWYNSGRRYSPDDAKRMRSNLDDEERRTRHRSAVEPDNENDDNFSADKTKNPKKLRKQKAMGEH